MPRSNNAPAAPSLPTPKPALASGKGAYDRVSIGPSCLWEFRVRVRVRSRFKVWVRFRDGVRVRVTVIV